MYKAKRFTSDDKLNHMWAELAADEDFDYYPALDDISDSHDIFDSNDLFDSDDISDSNDLFGSDESQQLGEYCWHLENLVEDLQYWNNHRTDMTDLATNMRWDLLAHYRASLLDLANKVNDLGLLKSGLFGVPLIIFLYMNFKDHIDILDRAEVAQDDNQGMRQLIIDMMARLLQLNSQVHPLVKNIETFKRELIDVDNMRSYVCALLADMVGRYPFRGRAVFILLTQALLKDDNINAARALFTLTHDDASARRTIVYIPTIVKSLIAVALKESLCCSNLTLGIIVNLVYFNSEVQKSFVDNGILDPLVEKISLALDSPVCSPEPKVLGVWVNLLGSLSAGNLEVQEKVARHSPDVFGLLVSILKKFSSSFHDDVLCALFSLSFDCQDNTDRVKASFADSGFKDFCYGRFYARFYAPFQTRLELSRDKTTSVSGHESVGSPDATATTISTDDLEARPNCGNF